MKKVNGATFRAMLVAGANRLETNKHRVDEMNVFPVPDGDTGTNMSHTMTAAIKEVLNSEGTTVAELASALKNGALRGARGNSGVILSQLFSGMAKSLKENKSMDGIALAVALHGGVEKAYKAVMKPKEGTILTVARAAAEAAVAAAVEKGSAEEVLQAAIDAGNETLAKTPDMLPVLKEAGVVDAGGQGLMVIYQGWMDALTSGGECEPLIALASAPAKEEETERKSSAPQGAFSTESIRFAYCTEFIAEKVDKAEEKEEELRSFLSSLGDSLVLVTDTNLVKVHVHTNDPGLVIQKATSLGELTSVKIENMRLQHQNILEIASEEKTAEPEKPAAPRKREGFVAVSTGDGFKALFESLGVDFVITGGQTMNPSTEDILNAAAEVNADTVYVLPNNKNIILAAQQAAEMLTDKELIVIPTKSVPQGITALVNFMPDGDPKETAAAMTESLATVQTGQVTFAVRDTHMGSFDIKENDILALLDDEICCVGQDLEETTKQLIAKMAAKDPAVVTVYYGADVEEGTANKLAESVSELCPEAQCELYDGGQLLYYYIISAE